MSGGWTELVRRGAAALLCLSLSGAVAMLAPPSESPRHLCRCPTRGGHHDCDCPLCHAEARLAAASATEATQPPCHQSRSRKIAADERAADGRRAEAGVVLSTSCGGDEGRAQPPPPTTERFTRPVAVSPAYAPLAFLLPAPVSAPASLPLEPDLPLLAPPSSRARAPAGRLVQASATRGPWREPARPTTGSGCCAR